MSIKFRTLQLITAGVISFAFAQGNARAGAVLELMSGSDIVTITDNGVGDLSGASGQVAWMGTINGWNFTVNVGDTMPFLGSATSPQLDLTVTANSPGSGNLVVMFSDTDFGPSAGSVNSTFFQNGSSTGSYQVLVDPSNALFGGSPLSDATLTGPYSITLVDTFTPGTVSSDHRVSVPDGGATVALLGFGLVGVEGLRRRFAAKR